MTEQIAWAVYTRDGGPVLWTIRDTKREAVRAWMQDYNQKFAESEPLDWKDSKQRLGTTVGCIVLKRVRDNTSELLAKHMDLMRCTARSPKRNCDSVASMTGTANLCDWLAWLADAAAIIRNGRDDGAGTSTGAGGIEQ